LAIAVLRTLGFLDHLAKRWITRSNIVIGTPIVRLLKPFVVDHFTEIARWHFGKLRFGEILQKAQIERRINWRNEES
jgi:hypothetical protein